MVTYSTLDHLKFVRLTLWGTIRPLMDSFYILICHGGLKQNGLIDSKESPLTTARRCNFLVKQILLCSICQWFYVT